jgi:alpha-tubulin suppressor-like RCC1 family protein
MAAGWVHSLILNNNGTLLGCGWNSSGQLGDGTTTARRSLTKIASLSGIVGIAAGVAHSLFVKSDGTLWACGLNFNGQLSDGTTTNRSTPIKVPITNVKSVAAGYYHSLLLKNDGTVWGWGSNHSCQLGNGGFADVNPYPVQIQPITGGMSMAGGWGHSLILTTDGTLWGVGDNDYGQLCDGTQAHQGTARITGTNVTAISSGSLADQSFFIKTDGTLWACGNNCYGQVGNGTVTNWQLTPAQPFLQF